MNDERREERRGEEEKEEEEEEERGRGKRKRKEEGSQHQLKGECLNTRTSEHLNI